MPLTELDFADCRQEKCTTPNGTVVDCDEPCQGGAAFDYASGTCEGDTQALGCCPARARANASFFDGTEIFGPSCDYQVFIRDEAFCGGSEGSWYMRVTANYSKEDCDNGVEPTERDVYVGNDIGSRQYPGFTIPCNDSGSGECDSCPSGMYCEGQRCRFPAGQCTTVSSCDVVELERRDRTTGELSWLQGDGMRTITNMVAQPGNEFGEQRVDYDYIDCRGQAQSFGTTYQFQTAFYTGNWRLQGYVSPCECNADPQSNVLVDPDPLPIEGPFVRFVGTIEHEGVFTPVTSEWHDNCNGGYLTLVANSNDDCEDPGELVALCGEPPFGFSEPWNTTAAMRKIGSCQGSGGGFIVKAYDRSGTIVATYSIPGGTISCTTGGDKVCTGTWESSETGTEP